MFKKIEIWILYLVLVLVFFSYIIFGSMVIRELKGNAKHIPIITPLSKAAVFLSEIPKNLMEMTGFNARHPHRSKRNQNSKISGFNRSKRNQDSEINGFKGITSEKENYLILSRFNGDKRRSVIELIDLKSFDVLHVWDPIIDDYLDDTDNLQDEKWKNFLKKSKDKRLKIYHPILQDDGSLIFQAHFSPLFKINSDSKLEWAKSDVAYHHSIEEDIDGNIWTCVVYYPFKIDKRNLVGNNISKFRDDGLRKLSPSGEILFDKSVSQLFIENKMEYLLFSMGDWEKDPIHLNDIEPIDFDGKHWKKGDVFLSLRNQSMVILYRPKTNEILWKSTGEFFNQHDVDILDDGKISIFDNNYKYHYKKKGIVDRHNRVIIYDFDKDEYSYHLNKSLAREKLKTDRGGRSEILHEGDLLVEETHGGRLLYFNGDGSLKWTYVNRADNDGVYNLGWSRILYEQKDISRVKNFLNEEIIK